MDGYPHGVCSRRAGRHAGREVVVLASCQSMYSIYINLLLTEPPSTLAADVS